MMNKKGQFEVARKMIYWPIAGIAITGIVLAYLFLVSGYAHKISMPSDNSQAESIALRFVNTCFAFKDEDTQRVSAGTIDLSKFTPENLRRCYPISTYKDYNFQLQLKSNDKSILTEEYYHKADFTIYKKVMVKGFNQEIYGDTLIIYVQRKI